MSGASLGHGTATGEPRAGRCQVEREDGRTSEVSPPRDTRPVEPGVKDGGQSDGRMGWAKIIEIHRIEHSAPPPLNRLTSCRISEAGGSRRKCPRCAE